MRKLVFALLLLCSALFATAQEWQWSVQLKGFISSETGKEPTAFLWIPSDCHQLRAVMVGKHNMSEETLFEMPRFREALSRMGIGLVWITPGIDQQWDVTKGTQEIFNRMMNDLAEVSGYSELEHIPVVPVGHSAMATYPWNFAAWNPERTLAVISLHGDAPRTNLCGYGGENLEWGRTRNIDGIPGLMIEGEYEWWEARVNPALAFRMMYPESCISFLCDTGRGHFDVAGQTADYIALFLRKALEYRLSGHPSLNEPVRLKKLNPKEGWLAERWRPEQKDRAKAAPYRDYKGDKHDAFWYFDKEMAGLTEARYAKYKGKQMQYLGFMQRGRLVKYDAGQHAGVIAAFRPEADGLTFHVKGVYTDSLRSSLIKEHAHGGIEVTRICGPVAKQGAEVVYEALPQWFDFAGDVLQQKPKSFDADGGMYESLNYANFGIQEALQFRLAWMNTHPGQKPVQIPQLDKLSDFFVHVCYPRTGILYNMNFGDSHKNVTAESTLMLLYAMGIRNDNMLWYMNQVEQGQHRDGYFIDRPMGFLYTPDLSKAPQLPEIKKSQLFADFGWATMRTSWEKDATMLAVKSGHTWNHSHADANSFIIFHKGVDIIKDAGNCWYPNPSYRNYFFQSEAHNVVLFNGKGQSREQQYHGSMLRGYLHYLLDADNVKYVLANGTGPYSDQFSRNFRHFLWIDDVIYMIDDLKTHDVGHFEWLWHPGGEAEKRGIDLNITNGNSSVVVRPLYPRLLAKSDFVHDYPEDLYWEEVEAPTEDLKGTETYYSFHLPAKVDRVKGLTAIILKETPDQKDLPYMERREGKDWIGLRIHYKGKITDLYINQLADGRLMHSNSWIEADGWFTDAYMFAVTYEAGMEPAGSKEHFICYGSALRRGDVSFFSSLAKLFVIQKEENGRMKLWMDGQPKMNAGFRSEKRPKAVVVNGKVTPVVYEKGTVKVSGVVIE